MGLVTRIRLSAAVAVLCVGISGCANTAAGLSATPVVPDAERTVTPSPAATPQPHWTVAFGDDCSRVLTDAQRDQILGAGSRTAAEWFAENSPTVDLTPAPSGAEPITVLGGIKCRWFVDEGGDLPDGMGDLTVSVFPLVAVAPEYRTALAAPRCDPSYDATICRQGRTVGDTWLLASSGWMLVEPPTTQSTAALDAVAANLADAPSPVPLTSSPEWWTFVGCDELGEALALSDLLGTHYFSGIWEGSAQFEQKILESAGVEMVCQYSSDSANIPADRDFSILTVTVRPGAASAGTFAAGDDETATLIDGAQTAFVNASGTVRSTDGTNVLIVASEGDGIEVEVMERALALLRG